MASRPSPRAQRSSSTRPRAKRARRPRTSCRSANRAQARAACGARRLFHRKDSMRGQMLWFNDKKDHGFIRTDEGERLQVDGAGFAPGQRPEGRCVDKVVTFEIDEDGSERRAQNVVFEQEAASRRA